MLQFRDREVEGNCELAEQAGCMLEEAFSVGVVRQSCEPCSEPERLRLQKLCPTDGEQLVDKSEQLLRAPRVVERHGRLERVHE